AHEEHGHEEHDDHDHDHGHEDDHGADAHAGHSHAHGAAYSGRSLWLGDIAWKWAPDGNNRNQQLRVAYEHALVRGLGPHAGRGDRHQAGYLSVVWRFAPAWEVGGRADVLHVREAHDDHLDPARLREASLMLAYKPTHAQ